MQNLKPANVKSRWQAWLYSKGLLLLGICVLLVFSNGRWILPLATWLAPVLILRYFRTATKLWHALLWTWLILVLTAPVIWLGLWPFPPQVILQIAAIGSAISLIPYLLDRFSIGRIGGVAQTLIFPVTAVALEFLGSLRAQGAWGNIAYTQTENLALLQFASLTGVWGITFLILWLAPVLNNLWENGFTIPSSRRALLVYGSTLAGILLFGSLRLLFFQPSGETVRVASVTPPEFFDFATPDDLQSFQRIMTKESIDPAVAESLREKLAGSFDTLFADTRREAQSGADLVVWPEGALISFDSDQDRELIERAKQVAVDERIYLAVTIAMVPLNPEKLNENRMLFIDPDGEVRDTYWKTYTVPVVEAPFAVQGSHRVALQETPFGRIAGVICADMDASRFLHDAGQKEADILLAPSGDWPAIKSLHSRMSIMRAVEQGFSLVRPANHGLTLAADYQGRVLGRMDHYMTSDRRMSVSVPVKGTTTLYARTGDLFAWLCVVLSALFLARLAQLFAGVRQKPFSDLEMQDNPGAV
ncbi:MAG: hypothetical protein JSU96_05415 [Acidobacteriota bacterium]|nr:MAG: hypothetical protein JSU96_05415 [Acidobacteriota bacterium]